MSGIPYLITLMAAGTVEPSSLVLPFCPIYIVPSSAMAILDGLVNLASESDPSMFPASLAPANVVTTPSGVILRIQ